MLPNAAPNVSPAPVNTLLIVNTGLLKSNTGIKSTPNQPSTIPIIAVPTIEIIKANLLPIAYKAITKKIPKTANKTVGCEKSPNPTNVAGLSTIIPALINPINVIKNPIPAPTANLSPTGIELIMIFLRPVTEIIKNKNPETNTADNAASHDKP